MKRTIVVKGIGRVKRAPDQMELGLVVQTREKEYEQTIEKADAYISKLNDAMVSEGIALEDIKTSNLSIQAEYENAQDARGNYVRRFVGYLCEHEMMIRVPLDLSLLGRLLRAVSQTNAHPQLSIRFTVKDKKSVVHELLASAAEDALEKARVLSEASGVTLGKLMHVEDDWQEAVIFSPTNMRVSEAMAMKDRHLAITPEDMDVSHTVRFVWAIE